VVKQAERDAGTRVDGALVQRHPAARHAATSHPPKFEKNRTRFEEKDKIWKVA
jgi:hypothetical protein